MAPEREYDLAVRCTGCFSFDKGLGEKTKAFGAGALFLAPCGLSDDSSRAVRLLGLKGCAFGEEGNAAADVNPVTAPEVFEVGVCGAGCRVA